MKIVLVSIFLSILLQSCTTSPLKKKEVEVQLQPIQGKVWIYKSDGSQSCSLRKGMTSKNFTELLRKKGVTVYEHRTVNDDKMRFTACGGNTGNIVELLIDGKDLPIVGKERFRLKKVKK